MYKIKRNYNYTPNQKRLIELQRKLKSTEGKWARFWIGMRIWWVLNVMSNEVDKKNRKGYL